MQIEEIEKFLDTKAKGEKDYVKIDFKKRESIYGLFVKDSDYRDLKSKNFWRIVTRPNFDAWDHSANKGLAKIFCGVEFTRLTLYKDSFE